MTDRQTEYESTTPVRLGVTGATGRMGRAVLAAAAERPAFEVVVAVTRSPTDAVVEGVAIEPAAAFTSLVGDREPHAVVDFTGPEAAVDYAECCAEAGVPFVTGTTDFDESHRDRLREASESIPLLHASNFSRGVAVLDELVAAAVRRLPASDIELVEAHHGEKRDAPSGTATHLLETIEAERAEAGGEDDRAHGREDDHAHDREGEHDRDGTHVHGREGDSPRETGDIGVHSVRAGSIAGEHEILLAGDGEELRLTHRAGDRRIFAAGALDAATWLAGRAPGWYDFTEVIET